MTLLTGSVFGQRFGRGALGLAVLGLGWSLSSSVSGQDVRVEVVKPGEVRIVKPDGGEGKFVIDQDVVVVPDGGDLPAPSLPKFWIGISGESASETLMAHLNLKHGVVVTDVMEDSPAAKAGLQAHDIVVEVNGQPVYRIQDFFGPVSESDGKPLKLNLVRGGKVEQLEVAPAPRPEQTLAVKPEDESEMIFLHPWGGNRTATGPFSGSMLNSLKNLDGNVTIRIEKDGEGPAKIEVKRGKEAWTVDENSLDELPPEIREMITSGEGSRPRWLSVSPERLVEGLDVNGLEETIRRQLEARQPLIERRMERREQRGGQSLNQRLERLTEMLESLQQEVEQLKK